MRKTINSVLQSTLGKIGIRKTKWILWALNALILIIVYNVSELSSLSFIGFSILIILTKYLQHIASLAEGMVAIMNRNKWFKDNVTSTTIEDKRDIVKRRNKTKDTRDISEA